MAAFVANFISQHYEHAMRTPDYYDRRPSALAGFFPMFAVAFGSTLISFFPNDEIEIAFAIFSSVLIFYLAGFAKLAVVMFRKNWEMTGLRALVLAASVPTAFLGLWSGDYLHLIAMYPYYEWTISKSPQGPVRFPWGEYGSFGTNAIRTLVYDKTGTAANPRGEATNLPDGSLVTTNRLMGDFYIETMSYD